jgi:hypothetical protein
MEHFSLQSMLVVLIYWATTNITNKNMEVLSDASKEFGLEVNAETTKYMFISSPECRTKSPI